MRHLAAAQLQQNFYASTCPNVERIVKKAVKKKLSQTFITIPATLRLFFHDCMINVCNYVYTIYISLSIYIFFR